MNTSNPFKIAGLFSMAVLLSAQSHAATVLGIHAGISSWHPDFTGHFNTTSLTNNQAGSKIDLEDDLGFGSDSNNVFYVALEHPIPFLPNIKLVRTELKSDAQATLNTNIDFNDVTFNQNVDVKSKLDLSHNDLTLYYEILDNWVQLDVGLTARNFDGEVSIKSATESTDQKLNATLPMLYGMAQFDLPLTGLSVGANLNYLSAGGNTLSDLDIYLNYKFAFGLGLSAGSRTFKIELDDQDNLDSNIKLSGAYFGASFNF